MLRFITPLVLLAAALGAFFLFSDPLYQEIKELRATEQGYDEALNNSRQLKEVRDTLLSRYNGFSTSNLSRLEKMVPDNVDNIRLIIEIERIAAQYGMALSNVMFDAGVGDAESDSRFVTQTADNQSLSNREYETFALEFSTKGTYPNFIRFVEDLERNLRVVDIDSVSFSSVASTGGIYEYSFAIKTYWLKN